MAKPTEKRFICGLTRAKIAGTVVNSKERITRTGSRMAWVRISDASGSVEVTCFSEVLTASREILVAGSNVVVTAGDASASVAFTAPSTTGGAPILEYIVRAVPTASGQTKTCSTTTT